MSATCSCSSWRRVFALCSSGSAPKQFRSDVELHQKIRARYIGDVFTNVRREKVGWSGRVVMAVPRTVCAYGVEYWVRLKNDTVEDDLCDWYLVPRSELEFLDLEGSDDTMPI